MENKYYCHLVVKFWIISWIYLSFYHCKLLCTLRWHRYPQPLFVPFSSSVDSCVVAVTLLTWLRDGKTNKKTFCGRLFHFMIPVTLVKAPREKTKMKTTTSSSSIKKKPIMCWFLIARISSDPRILFVVTFSFPLPWTNFEKVSKSL